MTDVIRTLDETIAWEQARLGISRQSPQCDWTTSTTTDDCAMFQSTALTGTPSAAWVPDWTSLPWGTFHAGHAGIRKGDVALFAWNSVPGPEHIEMVLVVNGGQATTIGPNTSESIAVARHTRPLDGSIYGYFRPNYATENASQQAIATTGKDPDMAFIITAKGRKALLLGAGKPTELSDEEEGVLSSTVTVRDFGTNARAYDVARAAYSRADA